MRFSTAREGPPVNAQNIEGSSPGWPLQLTQAGDLLYGSSVRVWHGTNPLPAGLADSLGPAIAYAPVRRFLVPKGSDTAFVRSVPMDLFGVPVSLLGVLKRLPGAFLPGLVILFLMGFRGGTMRMGGDIMQLGASWMILIMRSVVITSRHSKDSLSPPISYGLPLPAYTRDRSIPALVASASPPW